MPRLARASSYELLHSPSVTATVIMDVLQMTLVEKTNVTNTILDKLESRGIAITDSCGTGSKKAHINEIVEELKTEAKHRDVFNRALNAGEDTAEVDFAIQRLILNKHNVRKKRGRRVNVKNEPQSAILRNISSSTTDSASSLSVPSSSIVSAPNQGPTTTDRHPLELKHTSSASPPPTKRMILVYIEGEDFPEMITLSKAISPECRGTSDFPNFQLSVLKANIEERLAPRIIDWSQLMTEVKNVQVKCSHQDVFAYVCEEEEQQRHIVLKGLRASAPSTTPASNQLGTQIFYLSSHIPS
jgi:hypothetical protein